MLYLPELNMKGQRESEKKELGVGEGSASFNISLMPLRHVQGLVAKLL